MAQQVELEVMPREVVGKASKRLRKAGIIPANISGHHQESQAVQIDAVTFARLLREHKTTNILSLKMQGGATQTALVRHIAHEPSTGKILHIDFFRVNLQEQLTTRVRLNFTGESPAVKIEGGVLLPLVETIEVECRAADIVDSLDVDISSLTELDAMLHASDVQLPTGFTLVTDPAEPIVKVNAPRVEEPTTETETTGTDDAATPASDVQNEA
jgi:large subunit ribosomal protein L25